MKPEEAAARQTLLAHALLIGVALVWGTTFPLVKSALREISPLLFNALRMALAALVLLLLNGRTLRSLSGRQWGLCTVAGVLLALGYQFQTAGLAQTTPSKAAFLTGIVVVLVPLLGSLPGLHAPGHAYPSLAAYAGALLAFVGLVLLTSNPEAGLAILSGLHLGEWLVLACAVVFALHLLTLGRIATAIPARALGTVQIMAAAGVMVAMLPMEHHRRLHWTPGVIWALLVTAVLATAAAFTIQSWAQQRLPPTHTALIFTLEPVFAWLTSLLFFGERLGARSLAGAGLILSGIVLSELGPTAFSRPAIQEVKP